MKVEQTVMQKARDLSKKYGAERAAQIMTADANRYSRDRKFAKSRECEMVIKDIKAGRI